MDPAYADIHIDNFENFNSLAFKDYLRRLISAEFTILSLVMHYPDDEVVLCGKPLFDIYRGYLRSEVIIPKPWQFFVTSSIGATQPVLYEQDDNIYSLCPEIKKPKLKSIEVKGGIRFIRFETDMFMLNAINVVKIH